MSLLYNEYMNQYFLKTNRIGFSKWKQEDIELALLLWQNPDVTKYIHAKGYFTFEEIYKRLETEIQNDNRYQVQYWPIYKLETNEFMGCCGLRPYQENTYELGIHLLPAYWKKGYGIEATSAVIQYAFMKLDAKALFAGHHPQNKASSQLLKRLDFQYISNKFYEPTGLLHPWYRKDSL